MQSLLQEKLYPGGTINNHSKNVRKKASKLTLAAALLQFRKDLSTMMSAEILGWLLDVLSWDLLLRLLFNWKVFSIMLYKLWAAGIIFT
jgi:hypothetical protein